MLIRHLSFALEALMIALVAAACLVGPAFPPMGIALLFLAGCVFVPAMIVSDVAAAMPGSRREVA